jgi:hypothetical protein
MIDMKTILWDTYYRTEFPDRPEKRPEFDSQVYEDSPPEFIRILWDTYYRSLGNQLETVRVDAIN